MAGIADDPMFDPVREPGCVRAPVRFWVTPSASPSSVMAGMVMVGCSASFACNLLYRGSPSTRPYRCSVGMDDDVDVVWIAVRGDAAVERGVVEPPVGRPLAPPLWRSPFGSRSGRRARAQSGNTTDTRARPRRRPSPADRTSRCPGCCSRSAIRDPGRLRATTPRRRTRPCRPSRSRRRPPSECRARESGPSDRPRRRPVFWSQRESVDKTRRAVASHVRYDHSATAVGERRRDVDT